MAQTADMEESHQIADELKNVLERDIWHCPEAVHALLPHRDPWNIDAVVESQLVCSVYWESIPVEHQGVQRHDWKWKCCIPNEPLEFISQIPRLKEWLMYQAQIIRFEQLKWMDEWIDMMGAAHFYEINLWAEEAASCMHLDPEHRKFFLNKIRRAMRFAVNPELHAAPELSPGADRRRVCAEAELERARAVTRGFPLHPH